MANLSRLEEKARLVSTVNPRMKVELYIICIFLIQYEAEDNFLPQPLFHFLPSIFFVNSQHGIKALPFHSSKFLPLLLILAQSSKSWIMAQRNQNNTNNHNNIFQGISSHLASSRLQQNDSVPQSSDMHNPFYLHNKDYPIQRGLNFEMHLAIFRYLKQSRASIQAKFKVQCHYISSQNKGIKRSL